MLIKIPQDVKNIISALCLKGYEAYVVGGCVRDSLLGKTPKDWDIATSATPNEVKGVFAGRRIIDTGLQHGTVTLVIKGEHYEVTTFRTDGTYSDSRRPDTVTFVRNLKEDLARRDFTINAMAYSPTAGLVDPFNGKEDLVAKIVRCVGNPNKRFQEDALRIMRAVRFVARLGFKLETKTHQAAISNKDLLDNIAAERISSELNQILLGATAENNVLAGNLQVLCKVIPELWVCRGFEQNNPHHDKTVLKHLFVSVVEAPTNIHIRLAMLLHDIGKPFSYTEDEDGKGHFYGHADLSAEMAKTILTRLKYDNTTIKTVTALVLHHDAEMIPTEPAVKRWLNKLGSEELMRQVIVVRKADIAAQSNYKRDEKLSNLSVVETVLGKIIEQGQCFSLKDLAVNGRDLMALGVKQGVEIGKKLNQLMGLVLDGELENDRDILIKFVQENL